MQKKNKDMQIRRSYNVNASLGRTSYALDVFTKEKKKKKKVLIGLSPARWIFLHKWGEKQTKERERERCYIQLQLFPKDGLWYSKETDAGIISRISYSLLIAIIIITSFHTKEDLASPPAEFTTWIHHWQHTSDVTHWSQHHSR